MLDRDLVQAKRRRLRKLSEVRGGATPVAEGPVAPLEEETDRPVAGDATGPVAEETTRPTEEVPLEDVIALPPPAETEEEEVKQSHLQEAPPPWAS